MTQFEQLNIHRSTGELRALSLLSSAFQKVCQGRSSIKEGDGFAKAEQLLQEGYGMLVLATHPSQRDTMELPNFLFQMGTQEGFRDRKMLAPIAYHHYAGKKNYLFRKAAKAAGIELVPVITISTRDYYRKKYKNKPKKAEKMKKWINDNKTNLEDQYLEKALEYLAQGGVVFLFPQVERQSSFAPNRRIKPVEALIEKAEEKGFNCLGISYLGIDIQGLGCRDDYEESKGFNPSSHYILKYGATVTMDELKNNIPLGSTIEQAVNARLKKLVSPAYVEGNKRPDTP